jgi:hypothetical protein
MDDHVDHDRELLRAAMEELDIDVSGLRDGDEDFDPWEPPPEPHWLVRCVWVVRRRVWRWSRPLVEPAVRRRVNHGWRSELVGVRRLRHCCDPWDRGDRVHVLEVHTSHDTGSPGPSCDLVLVAPGHRGYRRAVRCWENGGIAGGRAAWFVWLVPGDRWDANLATEAKRRWLSAVLGRDDVELT